MPFAAIDFGTSNSTIGVLQGGNPTLLQPQGTHSAVPTALFYPASGNVLHGFEAINSYIDGEPGRFLRGLKSVLGTELFAETTLLQRRQQNFAEIIATYLRWLTHTAETTLGEKLTHVMIGRPVHFLTNNPGADALAEAQLREIAQTHLGIPHVEFLAEPLAAAYHYETTLHAGELALIIDIGGGTTDLSILNLSPAKVHQANRTQDILATHGLRLGGMGIDQLFALAHTMPHLGLGSEIAGPMGAKGLTVPQTYYTQLTSWHRIHRMYESSTISEVKSVLTEALEPRKVERLLELLLQRGGHRLMFGVEAAKIALSSQPETELNLSWLEQNLSVPLTQTHLATSIEGWLQTLTESIHHTLHLAGLQPHQIATAFLTGGPSAMPLVKNTIRQTLPQTTLIQGNQLTSVGQGLTLAAARTFA